MSITTRAAIARAPHVGWEIVDLQLDEVNEGYQDMLDGKNIRGVIIHEH